MKEQTIYATVGRDGVVVGYTWRVWVAGTSFYLKCRAPGAGLWKLSLHGDDPRHPVGGGFKFALEPGALEKAVGSGQQAVVVDPTTFPVWFPGKIVADDARLACRLRWTWEACHRPAPAPPPPGDLKGATGVVARCPPEPNDAVDVDFIVSESRPYWPNEKQARKDNACIGPLVNSSGQYLTGTVIRRWMLKHPSPEALTGPKPSGREDTVRGTSAGVHDGHLWIQEQLMSRAVLYASSLTSTDHGLRLPEIES